MNTLLASAIGAGIGYYAGVGTMAKAHTGNGALVGAAVGAIGAILLTKSGISQHYTWQKYLVPGYRQHILV